MSFIQKATIMLGRCVEVTRAEGIEVIVTLRELDKNLRMFFAERYNLIAHDPKEECKIGDIVLIKKLDKPLTRKITHEVVNIIYHVGDVTDPVTGKKVIVSQYRDAIEERELLFSESKPSSYASYMAQLKKRQAKDMQTNEKPTS